MIKLFKFPVPPSTNGLYKNVGKRRARSEAYREYIHECDEWESLNAYAVSVARSAIENINLVSLELEFNLPQEKLFTKKGEVKRYDLSNRIKALEDQLFKMLGRDDSCVFEIKSVKYLSDLNSVNITIRDYKEGL